MSFDDTDQPMGPPSPKARIIILLTFNGNIDFLNSYIYRTWSDHWRTISKLASSKVRYPDEAFDDTWLLNNKLETVDIDDLTEDLIIKLIPGCYKGSEWRGFEYKHNPFRSWHFVTHQAPQFFPDDDQMKTVGMSWYKVIESYGQRIHWHGLVNFIFPRPSSVVKDIFSLDDEAHLAPVWGNWRNAQIYLDDQASWEIQRGTIPSGVQWVDGNNLKPRNPWRAARDGESPLYTGLFNDDYKKYLSDHFDCYSTITEIYDDRYEAIGRANDVCELYTDRWFLIDCKQLIAPFKTTAPEGYEGEEVIILLNVSDDDINDFVDPGPNSWLRYAPVIIISRK